MFTLWESSNMGKKWLNWVKSYVMDNWTKWCQKFLQWKIDEGL